MAPMTMAARREKRKLAKNPPVTKYNLDPTTPVHRQSLATAAHAPAMVEARQPAVTPQLRYAIPDQPQRSELSMNRNKSEHKGQSDWMVPFCHHPESDHTTALEGLFIPCLLYGKTHWRLKNVALGRDPHDFKPSDGCNSMCWIHGALTAACCLSSKYILGSIFIIPLLINKNSRSYSYTTCPDSRPIQNIRVYGERCHQVMFLWSMCDDAT